MRLHLYKIPAFIPSCPEHFYVEQKTDEEGKLVWALFVRELYKGSWHSEAYGHYREIGQAFSEGFFLAQETHYSIAKKGGCGNPECLWCIEFSTKIQENLRREKEWVQKERAKWDKTYAKLKKETTTKLFSPKNPKPITKDFALLAASALLENDKGIAT